MQFKNILLDSESMKEWAKGMFLILLPTLERMYLDLLFTHEENTGDFNWVLTSYVSR